MNKPLKAHIWDKAPLDWYVEEERASEALFGAERFVGGILDPACGSGNIVKSALAAGYAAIGCDVVQRVNPRPDWFHDPMDFLECGSGWPQQNIVCNPPFFKGRGTEAFIRKALKVARGKVAIFADVNFLASTRRAEGLWADHPPHRIWIITPRVSCPPGEYLVAGNKAGGGTVDWAWFVWCLTEPPSRGPIVGWLRTKRVAA